MQVFVTINGGSLHFYEVFELVIFWNFELRHYVFRYPSTMKFCLELFKNVVGATKYFRITTNFCKYHLMLNYYFLRSCFPVKALLNYICLLNLLQLIIVNVQLFFCFRKQKLYSMDYENHISIKQQLFEYRI